MDKLVGKTVVQATYDGECIYLDCGTDGVFKLQPEGECCANCFIEHVSGSNAFPGTISEIRDVDSSTVADDYDQSCDVSQSWGHLFITDKGYCAVEMRVNHNGYYGGSLNCIKVSAARGNTLDEV